jgi:transcriptional regulator GlxA family with amidase domain
MKNNDPHTLGLLLIDGFALMSYASVIEPFRAANALAGTDLYEWLHVTVDGRPARASNGASVIADRKVGDALECDTLFVFAAGDPASFADAATFAWLRKLAVAGTRLAGVSGGPFLLARAGLLEGYRATIHWDHQLAFLEQFPTVAFEPALYVVDRRRLTCAGGTAGLDLAIELIDREQGHDLATRVGEWFIRTEARSADRPQRLSLRDRYAVHDDRLLKVLAEMETSVEDPLARKDLASIAGISVRQLERLFLLHLGESVNGAYMRIRLDQAQQLVQKSGMSVMAVAVACGFRSASHFARAYRRRFSVSPSRQRAT